MLKLVVLALALAHIQAYPKYGSIPLNGQLTAPAPPTATPAPTPAAPAPAPNSYPNPNPYAGYGAPTQSPYGIPFPSPYGYGAPVQAPAYGGFGSFPGYGSPVQAPAYGFGSFGGYANPSFGYNAIPYGPYGSQNYAGSSVPGDTLIRNSNQNTGYIAGSKSSGGGYY